MTRVLRQIFVAHPRACFSSITRYLGTLNIANPSSFSSKARMWLFGCQSFSGTAVDDQKAH